MHFLFQIKRHVLKFYFHCHRLSLVFSSAVSQALSLTWGVRTGRPLFTELSIIPLHRH